MPHLAPRTPGSVYRLQLNRDFPFDAATRIVPYLRRLGITDLYLSPILQARSTSTHNYDGVDASKIDPKLGGEEAFGRLRAELLANDSMGIVLDIVPNHMAASHENGWWRDVLENGQSSKFASYFDIDWRIRDENGIAYVRVPILGRPFRELLEAGEIRLDRAPGSEGSDEAEIVYWDHRLPLSPETKAEGAKLLQDGGASLEALSALLSRQHYRLVYWLDAEAPINYRRFLDVNELIGLKVEDPAVFAAYHQRVLEFVKSGAVTGLRIDHIDGLHDPKIYTDELQEAMGPKLPVFVEKFVGPGEDLPPDWDVSGTTGYDALAMITRAQIDPEGLKELDRIHMDFTDERADREAMIFEKKRRVLPVFFPTEYESLKARLVTLAQADPDAIEFSADDLMSALLEITACLDVYRTYLSEDGAISRDDLLAIEAAALKAENHLLNWSESAARALGFIRRLLTGRVEPVGLPRQEAIDFAMRWQQFCTAVMSIARDNSSTFDFNRLISVSEMGIDSRTMPFTAKDFHDYWVRRVKHWPVSMNTTSTHDTKRSEDVRARLHVLSEVPTEWESRLRKWSEWNARHKTGLDHVSAPDAEFETHLYQALLGAWPNQDGQLPEFRTRLASYLVKGCREAGRHSNWGTPNAPYEQGVVEFAEKLLAPSADNPFYGDFLDFQARLAIPGMINSLAQVLLKVTLPGIPDIYWGNEMWDYSLTDPDNRRPVDFESHERLLAALMDSEENAGTFKDRFLDGLLRDWKDGRIKLFTSYKALQFRRSRHQLFMTGDYLPLEVQGEESEHVLAFARRQGRDWSVVAVPRFIARKNGLPDPNSMDGERPAWARLFSGSLSISLPAEAPASWKNLFTGHELVLSEGSLELAESLNRFPVVLLSGSKEATH